MEGVAYLPAGRDSSSPVAFTPPPEPGFLASVRFAHFPHSRAQIPFESRAKENPITFVMG